MTREEELAALIEEQKTDDTYFVRGDGHHTVNIDALDNYLSEDEEGFVVSHLRHEKGTVLVEPVTGNEPWHGTVGGYTNHRCRCPRCTAANTEYHAERRERKRQERRAA